MIAFGMRAFRARPGFAALLLPACLAIPLVAASQAQADRIKHPIAIFSGLDKITGRIIAFEVATDETVQFGSLQITERACYTRPATETPQTTTFIEVDEVDANNEYKRIFSGWMFAASPGLHGIEHPIYDIWLTGCKGGAETVANVPEPAETEPAPLENAKPAENAKPSEKKPARQRRAPAANDLATEQPPAAGRTLPPSQGPIEVGPPPGLIPNVPRERRAPVQRFYPTAPTAPRETPGAGGF